MFLYKFKILRSKIWVYFFDVRQSLRMVSRFILDMLNSIILFLKKISIRSIKIIILIKF